MQNGSLCFRHLFEDKAGIIPLRGTPYDNFFSHFYLSPQRQNGVVFTIDTAQSKAPWPRRLPKKQLEPNKLWTSALVVEWSETAPQIHLERLQSNGPPSVRAELDLAQVETRESSQPA